ncbi:universal stress protein [Nesterenkonia sp. Act20]|uniref:universal stress protein n=1 Tax=Nesterenkonia sp. Act20 TaxID=1483432 RepID=UPI001C443EA2|nr:universal stress protein [Nesterenkonia sp. Act20]
MMTPEGAIVLGYGGSEHSKIALAWADNIAAELSRPLQVIVSALHVRGAAEVPQHLRAGHVTDELNQLLADAKAPQTSVTNVLNAPGEALVRESKHAYLTVLGSRTHGPLQSMVYGSVSQHVTRQAAGPVVVVREPYTPRAGLIVVGIDGSEPSKHALEFAVRHARDTGGRILAMHVQSKHDGHTDGQVDQVLAEARLNDVPLEIEHVRGIASEKLAEASREADLLVTGTRGRSPLSTLIMGSVSHAVLEHSQCPVAVVR